MTTVTETRESVREYYGRVLAHSSHLKTDACCSPDGMAPY
ncbi:MAG: methyltransferase type 11, partial [Planctomycetes bacterium]|nr:methyltransferase type 11 [Planctomycetota bacterium]